MNKFMYKGLLKKPNYIVVYKEKYQDKYNFTNKSVNVEHYGVLGMKASVRPPYAGFPGWGCTVDCDCPKCSYNKTQLMGVT